MKLSFIVRGQVKGKQRPKATTIGGQPRVYTPKETTTYENYIRQCYLDSCGAYYFEDKPIKVSIRIVYQANESLKKIEDFKYVACCKKPDVDNVSKCILDALNKVAYDDDSQVIELKVVKEYGSTEFVQIEISDEDLDCLFSNEKELREHNKEMKLRERFHQLNTKKKLTKTEKQRLEELANILKEN